MTREPHSPFDGLRRGHGLGVTFVAVLAFVLAGLTMMPPSCPADASPRRVAAETPAPIASPSTIASPEASPSSAPTVAPSASPDTAPTPTPTPSPSPTPTPSPSPTPAGPESEVEKIGRITDRMEHLNPTLKDWSAEVAIDARVKLALLVLPMELHGRSYHKAPDKYKFELQNAPALLQKYQQVFGYRPIVMTDFIATLLADEMVDGRPTYVVRLDKKGDSDFRSQTVWIDKETFTSPRRLYEYKDNGKIDVTFTWRKEKDWTVIDAMEAKLDFPKVSATASVQARYNTYQFNAGLDDALFVEKKQPR